MVFDDITFLDPLYNKIQSFIVEGQSDCLQKSISMYGSDLDIYNLVESIKNKYNSQKEKLVLVDLVPFSSLGTNTRLIKLEECHKETPFVLVAKRGIVYEQLKALKNLTIIICDENSKIIDIVYAKNVKSKIGTLLNKQFEKEEKFIDVKLKYIQNDMLKIIDSCIRRPPQNTRFELNDGAWANMWIDVKAILEKTEFAFYIAFHMGYFLTHGYYENLPEDGFVSGNNTAYILASFLHLIFENKFLIIIDKLGPYPSLGYFQTVDLEKINGKKLIMVEDVISTGREIDMTQIIAYLHNSEITRVVGLFNLEIALSRLISQDHTISLCKPSKNIKYLRVPKYSEGYIY